MVTEGLASLTEEQVEILDDAISTYGVEMQTTKAIEEMSELINALCAFKEMIRSELDYTDEAQDEIRKNIAEEIADVHIMLAQMRFFFSYREEQQDIINFKIKRLKGRIEYEKR